MAFALLGVLPTAPLRAQVCAGFPSLGDTRFRVAGSATFHTYATALGVSFTAGKKVYATVGAGRTRDAELDASTVDLSLEVGSDIAVGRGRRAFLCPLGAFSASLGPSDFLMSEADYDTIKGALGFGLAAVAARSRRFAVLPAGGLRVALEQVTYTPSGRAREDGVRGRGWERDFYWLASFGVGLVLSDVLTIRPYVTAPFGLGDPADPRPLGGPYAFAVPFGREEREVSLGINVGVTFGRRTRASP